MVDLPTALARQERIALLEGALEASQNGVLVLDLEGRIVRYNHQYLKLFDFTAEALDAQGTDVIVRVLASQLEDPGQLLVNRPALWSNPELEVLDTLRFKDGRVYERFIAPYRVGGRILGRVASFRDVTEAIRTAQSQKLQAVGRLAGGIAHDLNNALTAIIGYAELALNGLEDGHQVKLDIQEIRRAASRAESVTRQLLAFSRKQMLEPRVFSLGGSLTNLSRSVDRLLTPNITLETSVPPDLPPVYGDPGQLEQAILNLVVNARDAMPAGGRLTLTLALADVDEAFARAHLPIPPGRYVELVVSDTGLGMSSDTRAHVFEPFFTTKDVGKGTGLGLAMVYGTVKQSGGYVFVDSELGQGCAVRIYLPPAQKGQEPPKEQAETVDAVAQTVILVVEDEGPVRNLVVTSLRRRGYQVLHAASGGEALAIAAAENRRIDLLLTDASMPGMSGLELARTLSQQRPEIRVLVMSGYTSEKLSHDGMSTSFALLAKPFTPHDLQEKITETLRAGVGVQPRP